MPHIALDLTDGLVQPAVSISRGQDRHQRPTVTLTLAADTVTISITADAIAAKEIAKALDRATWREAPE